MNFYGRDEQRALLKTFIKRDFLQVGLIYGRRRVGKSALITQVLAETKALGIYHECTQTSEFHNIESLSELIVDLFDIFKPSFKNLEEQLDFLFQKAQKQKIVLVLDEYPYLRRVIVGLDSILQALIDKYRRKSQLKLILCGSYIDIMKSLLEVENPLFGRVDMTIDLKPMDYYESAMFYPSFSHEDKVRLYSIFGGIPQYNQFINPNLSVRENVIELIIQSGARLENEVSTYVLSEIARINNSNKVFDALAKGYTRFSDILSQSQTTSGPTLVDVLDRMIHMELVKKTTPINDENNKRKTSYHVIDNFCLFYYRYIFRRLSQRTIMNPNVFYERYIHEDFETQYVPHIFENICKEYLIRMNRKGELSEVFDRIGKYYYDNPVHKQNGEFDIVTEDPNGYIFYEAKFRKEPLDANLINKEIQQVKATSLSCYRYGFFSRSGFADALDENVIGFTLDDLYAD